MGKLDLSQQTIAQWRSGHPSVPFPVRPAASGAVPEGWDVKLRSREAPLPSNGAAPRVRPSFRPDRRFVKGVILPEAS